jgi:hypothetical protein
MRISDAQKAEVLQRLIERTGRFMNCSVCHSERFVPSDIVFELREFNNGDLFVGGPILPVLPVSCGACGHTLFFNALHLGLVVTPDVTPGASDAR